MRFFYADAGLFTNSAHNANSCRFITRELRARGIDTTILIYDKADPSLFDELDAKPFFRMNAYIMSDDDPISGWLNAFVAGSEMTAADFRSLTDITGDDILYLNSAHPIQFMSLIQWLDSLPPQKRPHTAMEFEGPPGVEMRLHEGEAMLGLPDLRIDPRAVFYRFAANRLRREPLEKLHLATFEPNSSDVYSELLGVDVGVLPFPHHATAPVRSRVGKRPVTVSVLGAQRPEKGYHLMPAVVANLLQRRRDFRFLAHNGWVQNSRDAQQAMRNIANADSRVQLDERIADEIVWRELLDKSDLIVCPYEPIRYTASYSAVVVEAVAYGIPVVVPARTALSRLIDEFGGPGTVFDDPEPGSIQDAIEEALDHYDDIATRAIAAAGQWERTQGPKNIVDALLGLAGGVMAL